MSARGRTGIVSTTGAWALVLLLLGCAAAGDGGSEGGEAREEGAGHDEHGEHEGPGAGEGVVALSPEAIARIGLATAPARIERLAPRRTTTGTVGYDETRLAHVGSRVSGRLVRVDAVLGDRVSAGETLALVDSLELGRAGAELLRARAREEVARRRFERELTLRDDRIASEEDVLAAEATARETAADLAAARETLRLLGLSDDRIAELGWENPGVSVAPVRSPFAGRVVAKEATRGELITPERTLFTIADVGVVWVWVDLYERDLRHVREGDAVEVSFDAWPDEAFSGELFYLGAELDAGSRTVRARVDLPNPDGRLRPGMFARVSLAASAGEAEPAIVVPRAAVVRMGEEAVVFVRLSGDRFERRVVATGRIAGELIEIPSGVAEGEEVVTEGAFLLRSEAASDELGGHHH